MLFVEKGYTLCDDPDVYSQESLKGLNGTLSGRLLFNIG